MRLRWFLNKIASSIPELFLRRDPRAALSNETPIVASDDYQVYFAGFNWIDTDELVVKRNQRNVRQEFFNQN